MSRANLCRTLLIAVLCAAAGADSRAPAASAPAQPSSAGDYALDFSQIEFNAGAARSSHYGVVDKTRIHLRGPAHEKSADYLLLDPLAKAPFANNGLALNQGTTIRVRWSDNGVPPDSLGFLVYRRSECPDPALSGPAEYACLTKEPLHGYEYVDLGLQKGIHFYQVFLIDAWNNEVPWTSVFAGMVTQDPAPQAWMLY